MAGFWAGTGPQTTSDNDEGHTTDAPKLRPQPRQPRQPQPPRLHSSNLKSCADVRDHADDNDRDDTALSKHIIQYFFYYTCTCRTSQFFDVTTREGEGKGGRCKKEIRYYRMLTCGIETAPMRWGGRDGVNGWTAPASRWRWGLCRDDAGAGRGRGARRWWKRRSGVELAVAAVSRWRQRGGVEVVVVAGSVGSRWRGRGAAGAGGGVEGAAKSLQSREVLPGRNG
ncbi:hypothetical protein EDB85DRAFT_2279778 [Lactarius pseudohatsudake]|nr:hypothetical protein EDB85DRAFT_2279778 [Lactarius pseudohatsudake]